METKEKKVPINVSFSVKHDSIAVLEQFNDMIEKGDLNRSAVFLKLMGDFLNGGKSNVEKMFDLYCADNHLNKDSQLMLLLGPYRVSNNGIDEFDKEPEDFPLFGVNNAN